MTCTSPSTEELDAIKRAYKVMEPRSHERPGEALWRGFLNGYLAAHQSPPALPSEREAEQALRRCWELSGAETADRYGPHHMDPAEVVGEVQRLRAEGEQADATAARQLEILTAIQGECYLASLAPDPHDLALGDPDKSVQEIARLARSALSPPTESNA